METSRLSRWGMRPTYLISTGAALLLISTVTMGLYLGLQTQERFRKVAASWSVFTEQADRKGLWLSEIRGHLGFGGIIHDFKNYVLRREPRYADAVKQRLPAVYLSIDGYLGLSIDVSERQALLAIRRTIDSYAARLPVAEGAARDGMPIGETDRMVRVDDTEAIQALAFLEEMWRRNWVGATSDVVEAVEEGEALINLGFRFLAGLGLVAITLFAMFLALVRQLNDTVHRLSAELSDRLRAEQAEKKLLRAVEQSPATIVITDTSGRIEYVNRRFEELTGYTRAAMIGQTPRVLQSGDTRIDQYAAIRATLAQGKEWRGVFRNRKKDGSSYWAETTILPLTDDDGVIRNFIGIGEDITEKRQAREQVIKAQKMEAVGLLAGGVAHDFNNVLTTILGAAHLASLDIDEKCDAGREITQIEIAARRAQALVQQLLTFARRQPGLAQRLDLRREVREVVRLVEASIPRSIKVVVALGDEPAWVEADPTHMHQVLMNLCRNAAEAVSPEAGVITLTVKPQAVASRVIADSSGVTNWVRLCVADNGSGVPPDVAERMFDPFFTTKPIGKGTGLGLTMVSTLLEEMGGSITLTSLPGQGARFEVLLPAAAPGDAEIEAKAEMPGGHENILLVDDEPDVVAVQRRLLMRLGYRVTAFTDPRVALASFRRDPSRYDLVLTDLVMPDLNGEALAAEVLRLKPGCPVVINTAYGPQADPRHSGAGIAVLAKPTPPSELARKLRELLDASSRAGTAAS